MANEYHISAGIIPIDNSTGATANSYYISAGLVPTDTAVQPGGIVYDDHGTWRGHMHGTRRGEMKIRYN